MLPVLLKGNSSFTDSRPRLHPCYHLSVTLTLPALAEKLKEWKGCELSKTANPVLGREIPRRRSCSSAKRPGSRKTGRGALVGPAGKFLDELLSSIGLKREDVYISNVVKFRPPGNREPTPGEKEQCMPWLKMEIALIKPKIIVPLGRHALGHFLARESISNAHGKPYTLTDEVTLFPIYHPAAALHNGGLRQSLMDDFHALKRFLDEWSSRKAVSD